MTDTRPDTGESGERRFIWHPEYQGRSADSVQRDLTEQIRGDQRQYDLALSGAEKSEHQALSSVMELEKRWSVYTFDWADEPAEDLAARILDFELERERRRSMISYKQYRAESGSAPRTSTPHHSYDALGDAQRRRNARVGAAVIVATMVIVIIVVLIFVG